MKQFFPERYNEYMTKSHKDKIHRAGKSAEGDKDLPFTFSKPKRSKPNRDFYQCDKCSRVLPMDSARTHVIICRCNNFIVIEESMINVLRERSSGSN